MSETINKTSCESDWHESDSMAPAEAPAHNTANAKERAPSLFMNEPIGEAYTTTRIFSFSGFFSAKPETVGSEPHMSRA